LDVIEGSSQDFSISEQRYGESCSLRDNYLVCPVGAMRFVSYDDRPGSNTFNTFQELVLSRQKNYVRLTIPPEIWMGFEGISENESLLLNFADIQHDPVEQENISVEESPIIFD
jgi:dTDP-4-dehydrorhamnose 3,5-epimerase